MRRCTRWILPLSLASLLTAGCNGGDLGASSDTDMGDMDMGDTLEVTPSDTLVAETTPEVAPETTTDMDSDMGDMDMAAPADTSPTAPDTSMQGMEM